MWWRKLRLNTRGKHSSSRAWTGEVLCFTCFISKYIVSDTHALLSFYKDWLFRRFIKVQLFVIFFISTSSKSKKRKSLVISNPIPCNTAFPTDHVSIHSSTDNTKDTVPSSPTKQPQSTSEETSLPEESSGLFKDVNSSDSDLSSSGTNTPKRQSVCDNENSDRSAGSQSPAEAGPEVAADADNEFATTQSDDSGMGVAKSGAAGQEVSNPFDSEDGDTPQSPMQEPSEDSPKPAPIPAPRISFRSTEKLPLLSAGKQEEKDEMAVNQESDLGDDSCSHNPPGFLYKVRYTHLWGFNTLESEMTFLLTR